MKRARASIPAAIVLLALAALPAAAVPFTGSYNGVASSVVPAAGPLTRRVVGDAATNTMRVRWDCGQPSPCEVTGPQYDVGAGQFLLMAPSGVTTPAPFFVLAPNADCTARFGSTARVGAWIVAAGTAVVKQCFTVTPPPRFTPDSDLPPIRFTPTPVPPRIRDLARNARPVSPAPLPPGAQLPPRP